MSDIHLKLTRDEALVLFEILSRFTEQDVLDASHQGEKQALWNTCGSLEKILDEPFSPDYDVKLRAAKDRLSN